MFSLGGYAHRRVPKSDKGVCDETEEITSEEDNGPGYDDDGYFASCNGMGWEPKDSVEKAEVVSRLTKESFQCNGTGNAFFEGMLRNSVERPAGKVKGRHVVPAVPADAAPVAKHELYVLIESLDPFGADVYWAKRWVKCDACYQTGSGCKKRAAAPSNASAKKGKKEAATRDVLIVDHSAQAYAILGKNTFHIKDKLKAIGARFDKSIAHNGAIVPGWILSKHLSDKLATIGLVRPLSAAAEAASGSSALGIAAEAASGSSALGMAAEAASGSSALGMSAVDDVLPPAISGDSASVSVTESGPPVSADDTAAAHAAVFVVDYSAKAYAVFGDTIRFKDKLKGIGASFNRFLTHNGKKVPGWVLPKTLSDKLPTIGLIAPLSVSATSAPVSSTMGVDPSCPPL